MHRIVDGVKSMLQSCLVIYATYCGSQPDSFRKVPEGFIGMPLREVHIA